MNIKLEPGLNLEDMLNNVDIKVEPGFNVEDMFNNVNIKVEPGLQQEPHEKMEYLGMFCVCCILKILWNLLK